VPLEELSDDDLNTFLSDDEKREFQTSMNEIAKGLARCINTGGVSPDLLTNIGIGLNSLQFQVDSLLPMHNIGLLLKKVYERKREEQRNQEEERKCKVEEEQRKRDEEERKRQEEAEAGRRKKEHDEKWEAAFLTLTPPLDDAKVYLKDEEYRKFRQALWETIEVYLKKGEGDVHDHRTFDYRWYLEKITKRKAQEAEKADAISEAKQYNASLNQEISKLKSKLEPKRKDLSSYFKLKIKDGRHTDHNFDYILSGEERNIFDSTLVRVASKRLEELIPKDLRQFIEIPAEYYRIYIPLPSTSYSNEQTPCLDFWFDIFAAVYAEVRLKPGQKTFGGYVFNLPWREEKGYSVLLQEPEFLGYDYVVLTPEDLGGYVPWKSIPLDLIKGLMNGELQPAATTILAASENGRIYRIKNFTEEVTIPRSFENYLKQIGNIEQMVSIGIVDQEVAKVIRENLSQSATERRAGAFQNGQAAVFTDEELISSLTSLGIARKASEELCSRVPRDLSLDEAIKFALQNQRKIIVD